MIFISGISNREEELDYSKQVICPNCSAYGRLEGYMSFMSLSVFFIPILKWNKRYFLKSRCCSTIYEVSKDLGREMEKNLDPNIREEDLQLVQKGHSKDKMCLNCGAKLEDNFEYCPTCGTKAR